jgi:hypothetical protein
MEKCYNNPTLDADGHARVSLHKNWLKWWNQMKNMKNNRTLQQRCWVVVLLLLLFAFLGASIVRQGSPEASSSTVPASSTPTWADGMSATAVLPTEDTGENPAHAPQQDLAPVSAQPETQTEDSDPKENLPQVEVSFIEELFPIVEDTVTSEPATPEEILDALHSATMGIADLPHQKFQQPEQKEELVPEPEPERQIEPELELEPEPEPESEPDISVEETPDEAEEEAAPPDPLEVLTQQGDPDLTAQPEREQLDTAEVPDPQAQEPPQTDDSLAQSKLSQPESEEMPDISPSEGEPVETDIFHKT